MLRYRKLSLQCLLLVTVTRLIIVHPALAQQKPKLRTLHVALANHSVSMTAVYVAKHLGIFEQYGFDARVLVLEPRAAIAALLAGELDLYDAANVFVRDQHEIGPIQRNQTDPNRYAAQRRPSGRTNGCVQVQLTCQ